MISLSDLYHVLTAAVPLYVPMVLAYVSVKWWKIFTPDQCSGINHFVALFAVPLVSFHFISSNNPYTMNLHFILADTLQKLIVLTLLSLWSKLSHNKDSTEWVITLFSISTLPNSLIMGIPLLQGMYGPSSASLVVQTVVLQCIIWHTVLLFLFECRRAKTLTMEQFPDNNASVTTSYILIIVWRKLIRNPNTYSSLIGLIWSLISFRWRIEMPEIVASSISILADGGKGMAMFSLGLFMALQPKIISCGKAVAAFAMAVKFIAGPAVMAAASIAVGLRGTQLRIAIVQATLPVGIVAFIFAKEYDVHPDILSTGIIFGMLIALPVTLLYYVLLGL